jgi:hypothetical protein
MLLLQRKTPKAMADKGKQPVEENSAPTKEANHSRVIFSSQPFLLFLIAIS